MGTEVRRPNVIRHNSTSDFNTGRIKVWCLVWYPKDAKNTGGWLIITDVDDTHLLHVYSNIVPGVGSAGKTITIYYPFGHEHMLTNGLKTFALPAGFVEYILE